MKKTRSRLGITKKKSDPANDLTAGMGLPALTSRPLVQSIQVSAMFTKCAGKSKSKVFFLSTKVYTQGRTCSLVVVVYVRFSTIFMCLI